MSKNTKRHPLPWALAWAWALAFALSVVVSLYAQQSELLLVGQGAPKSSGYNDSFAYSAGDLAAESGGNWSYPTGLSTVFAVQSGGGAVNVTGSSSVQQFAYWSGSGYGTFTPSQYSAVTLQNGTYGYLTPAVLISPSANTGYFLDFSGSGVGYVGIGKLVAGSGSTVCYSGGFTVGAGDVWEIEVSVSTSDTFTVKQNGSVASGLSCTDSSSPLSTGTPGIVGYNQYGYDNASITNAKGGSGTL